MDLNSKEGRFNVRVQTRYSFNLPMADNKCVIKVDKAKEMVQKKREDVTDENWS
jgi:hypothetical protein